MACHTLNEHWTYQLCYARFASLICQQSSFADQRGGKYRKCIDRYMLAQSESASKPGWYEREHLNERLLLFIVVPTSVDVVDRCICCVSLTPLHSMSCALTATCIKVQSRTACRVTEQPGPALRRSRWPHVAYVYAPLVNWCTKATFECSGCSMATAYRWHLSGGLYQYQGSFGYAGNDKQQAGAHSSAITSIKCVQCIETCVTKDALEQHMRL